MLMAMLALACGAQSAPVPITNGGFEEREAGWLIETGRVGDDAGGPNRVEFIADSAFEGGRCARLSYRRSWLWLTTSSLPDSVNDRQLTVRLRARWVSGSPELDVGFTEFAKGKREWAAAHDSRFVGRVPTDRAWHGLVFALDVPSYDAETRDVGLKLGCGHGEPSELWLDAVEIIDAAPRPATSPPPLMVDNPGCEEDGAGWASEIGEGSRLAWPQDGAHSGRQCAELQHPGHGWAWLTTPMPDVAPGQSLVLELWAQRLGEGDRLMVGFSEVSRQTGGWVAAHDDVWSGALPAAGEWQRLEAPIRVPAYDTLSNRLNLKIGLAGAGPPETVRLDDIRVIGQPDAPEAPPFIEAPDIPLRRSLPGRTRHEARVGPVEVRLATVLPVGQGVLAPLVVELTNEGDQQADVALRVHGPTGSGAEESAVTLPSSGRRTVRLPFRTLQALPHEVVVEVSTEGERLGFPVEVTPERAFPVFGVVEHFDRTPPGPARAGRDVALLHQLPCSAYRIDCGWGAVEPQPGQPYRFEGPDAYIGLVRSGGHSPVLTMLGYQPGWAGAFDDPEDEAKLAAYQAAIRAIVARYADQVDYWEAWNEPGGFWFGGDTDAWLSKGPPMLLAVQRTVWEAVRELDPTARVLTPGFVPSALHPGTPDWRVIEALYGLGWDRYFDAMCVHVYPNWLPPSVTPYTIDGQPVWQLDRWQALDRAASMAELAGLMARAGRPKPIWVTEFGGFNPTDERSQALACLRTLGTMAAQRLEGALYYELFDYPHDAHPPQLYLVRGRDLHRTLGFVAYQDAIRALTGAAYAPSACRVAAPEGIEARTFTRAGERVALLWSNAPAVRRVRLDWECEAERVEVISWNPARSPMRDTEAAPAGHSTTLRLAPLGFALVTARARGWQDE